VKQTNLKLKRSERAQQQEARAKALLEKRYEKLKEQYQALREASKNVADDDEEEESGSRRRGHGSRENRAGPSRDEYVAKLRNHRHLKSPPQKGFKVTKADEDEDEEEQEMEKENSKPKQSSLSDQDKLVLRNGRVVDHAVGGGELDSHFFQLSLAERARRAKNESREQSGVRTRARAQESRKLSHSYLLNYFHLRVYKNR